MNRAEEFAFAWALLDHAAAFLDGPNRAQLCIRIGTGELREAIVELLQCFTISGTSIPPVLAASLWAWMNGFVGSDFEIPLRDLAGRIRVSNVRALPNARQEDSFHGPVQASPRRGERSPLRLVLTG